MMTLCCGNGTANTQLWLTYCIAFPLMRLAAALQTEHLKGALVTPSSVELSLLRPCPV